MEKCMETFIGKPLTTWNSEYGLQLVEDFGYVDQNGKIWLAAKGTYLSGCSIPKPLWSRIGSPFLGSFRKACIVHNNYIGTQPSPFCDINQRRKADAMFYHASKHCGCGNRLSSILYICASISTWTCKNYDTFSDYFNKAIDDISWCSNSQKIDFLFVEIMEQLESKLADISFGELEDFISKKLFSQEL